jgi:Mg2+-importing ATPase
MSAFTAYTNKSVDATLHELQTSREAGLSHAQAHERLQTHGRNAIATERRTARGILLRQFASSFVFLLFAAAGIALALGEWFDASMIILFIAINASLGFFQEYRSEQAMRLLSHYLVAHARVRRAGHELTIESEELVPGDIVRLEAGDIIPADVRLLMMHGFVGDESTLSGESTPALKSVAPLPNPTKDIYRAANIGFSGTVVTSGSAEGVVVATGGNTAIGEIAKLVAETPRESVFEKGMNQFSVFILRLVLVTIVVVFFANVFLKGGQADIPALLVFSIALAVSVVPEALPTVTTFSLSRGALRLAQRKVVVRRLSAIEDLGGIEILCSDKTGTLTENHLSVVETRAENPSEAIRIAAAVTASDARAHDAFDMALRDQLSSTELERIRSWRQVAAIPFDPVRRRSSALVTQGHATELFVRGAAEVVLPACGMSHDVRRAHESWICEQGKLGRRVLAVARRVMEPNAAYKSEDELEDISCVGMIAFADPVKHTTLEAVRKAERLGVTIKILTGDSREVAGAVAYEVGMIDDPGEVMTGEELEVLSVENQHNAVMKFDVFARVSPEQKHHIIQLLQETNEVGFLGEGVNDAAALKAANVAIVVKGASDVAREAADIVLMQKSLHVIVDGIQEGRQVFANTIKYVRATLTSNFGNFYALAFATFFIETLPMLPLQILFLNLLSDFPMIAVATDRVESAELKNPRRYDIAQIALFATVLGLVSTVFDFIFFALYMHAQPEVLHTNWFIGSVLTELALVFSIRTRGPFFRAAAPSVALAILSFTAAAIAVIAPFTPLGQRVFSFSMPQPAHLMTIGSLIAAYFCVTEVVKLLYVRFANSRPPAA